MAYVLGAVDKKDDIKAAKKHVDILAAKRKAEIAKQSVATVKQQALAGDRAKIAKSEALAARTMAAEAKLALADTIRLEQEQVLSAQAVANAEVKKVEETVSAISSGVDKKDAIKEAKRQAEEKARQAKIVAAKEVLKARLARDAAVEKAKKKIAEKKAAEKAATGQTIVPQGSSELLNDLEEPRAEAGLPEVIVGAPPSSSTTPAEEIAEQQVAELERAADAALASVQGVNPLALAGAAALGILVLRKLLK